MPRVWDALWGGLPARTGGVPVVLGEWGGLWDGDESRQKRATGAWQTALAAYLAERGISSFCTPHARAARARATRAHATCTRHA